MRYWKYILPLFLIGVVGCTERTDIRKDLLDFGETKNTIFANYHEVDLKIEYFEVPYIGGFLPLKYKPQLSIDPFSQDIHDSLVGFDVNGTYVEPIPLERHDYYQVLLSPDKDSDEYLECSLASFTENSVYGQVTFPGKLSESYFAFCPQLPVGITGNDRFIGRPIAERIKDQAFLGFVTDEKIDWLSSSDHTEVTAEFMDNFAQATPHGLSEIEKYHDRFVLVQLIGLVDSSIFYFE